MTLISWGFESLTFEDMAQMASTCSANNLYAQHSARSVFMASDSSWNSILVKVIVYQPTLQILVLRKPLRISFTIECRPSTARIELCSGAIQGSIASRTGIGSIGRVFVELSSVGSLSVLFSQHFELLGRQHCSPLNTDQLDLKVS